MSDLEFMQRAIAHARSVEERTSPRPPVGAVVVRDDAIVGQGATSPPYGPHAEIHALNAAGAAAQGADLYTTLEPCCITVHTPPCTRAIIAAGVSRVIVGSFDPNPQVYTRGIEQLRAAGITVTTTIASEETDEILRPFATYITQGRPYVTAKWTMTLDGKLATHTGDACWISGAASRIWVHNLRDRVDAILIGAGTARSDNPKLTVRLSDEQRNIKRAPREGPLRVILATQSKLPAHQHVLQPELAVGTCIIVGESCPNERQQQLRDYGLDVVAVAMDETGRVDLRVALEVLARKGIMHVLLEGGGQLLGNAFDRALIDHVAVFIAPKLIGGHSTPSPIAGLGLASMRDALSLRRVHTQTIDGDLLIEGDSILETQHGRGHSH